MVAVGAVLLDRQRRERSTDGHDRRRSRRRRARVAVLVHQPRGLGNDQDHRVVVREQRAARTRRPERHCHRTRPLTCVGEGQQGAGLTATRASSTRVPPASTRSGGVEGRQRRDDQGRALARQQLARGGVRDRDRRASRTAQRATSGPPDRSRRSAPRPRPRSSRAAASTPAAESGASISPGPRPTSRAVYDSSYQNPW